MGNEKWRKGNGRSHRLINLYRLRYHCAVLILTGLLSFGPLTADSTAGIRLIPGYYHPAEVSQMKFGIGGAVTFDLHPADFFGVFAQGEYITMSMQTSQIQSVSILDGSLGTGLRWRLNDAFSLRADLTAGIYSAYWKKPIALGISGGLRASADFRFSPVLGVTMNAGFKHFALTPKPFLNTFTAGFSLMINLTEAFNTRTKITGKVEKQNPVFPVLYSWYDDNGFAEVKIVNNEAETITDCRVSFYLEQYMGQPKVCATVPSLKPGESVYVPITAFFNETILELNEKITAEAKVIVEYKRLGADQTAEIPVSFPVFHRNAMSWEDDRRAAAFVSAKDPAALWFSKYTSGIVSERFRGGINRNIQYAMGLFEALNVYGINYVIDPTSSYAELASNSSVIDFLQYPYQTLMYRAGDCDDLSILYCSLLEAIGIETAFLTIPGHIYAAFSTGVSETEAKNTFGTPNQFIYLNGIAWVPVEITLLKEGFNKAWRIGAKEWNDNAARGSARILPMKDSWDICKPVSIRGAASRFTLPDETRTVSSFDGSLTAFAEREIRPKVRAFEAMLARSEDPEVRNRLGVLYAEYGMFDDAKLQFGRASMSENTDALVNLGNLYFIEQNYKEALAFYSNVLSADRTNALALLGAARCYYELEEFLYSDALYAELSGKDPVLGAQYAYLNSFFDSRGRAWSFADRLATTKWSGSAAADKAVPDKTAPFVPEARIPVALVPKSGGLGSMLSPTGEAEVVEIASVPVMSAMEIPLIAVAEPASDELAPPVPPFLETALSSIASASPSQDGKPIVLSAPPVTETPPVRFESRASRIDGIILAEDPVPEPESIPSWDPSPLVAALPVPGLPSEPDHGSVPEVEPPERDAEPGPEIGYEPEPVAVPSSEGPTFAEILMAAVNDAVREFKTGAAGKPAPAERETAAIDGKAAPSLRAVASAVRPSEKTPADRPAAADLPAAADNAADRTPPAPEIVVSEETPPAVGPAAAASEVPEKKPVPVVMIIVAGAAAVGTALFTRFRLRWKKRGQGKKS